MSLSKCESVYNTSQDKMNHVNRCLIRNNYWCHESVNRWNKIHEYNKRMKKQWIQHAFHFWKTITPELKRAVVPSWDTTFMEMAHTISKRTKDPRTRVGAVIVTKDNIVAGLGYNGFPRGVSDDVFPWKRTGGWINTKYPYVCHAEANAILNRNMMDIKGGTIYTTLFPCHECARLIIQCGLKRVVFDDDRWMHKDSGLASLRMLNHVNTDLIKI